MLLRSLASGALGLLKHFLKSEVKGHGGKHSGAPGEFEQTKNRGNQGDQQAGEFFRVPGGDSLFGQASDPPPDEDNKQDHDGIAEIDAIVQINIMGILNPVVCRELEALFVIGHTSEGKMRKEPFINGISDEDGVGAVLVF